MGIKFNPLAIEGLDVTGSGGATPTVGSTVIPGSVGNSVLTTDSSGVLDEVVLADGQLIVGSTGNEPVVASISGTTDQITVTNGPGNITLSLPQDIATDSAVEFSSVTASSLDVAAPGTLTIGAINSDIINIGNPGSQVNLQGDVNILNTTLLDVENPIIRTNVGGPAASAGGAGLEVEEDGVATGYDKVAADRLSWQLKAPGRDGTINLQPPVAGNLLINQELFDSKYDASNPSGFETPAQLDARDTANRDRANHTGTQAATTVSVVPTVDLTSTDVQAALEELQTDVLGRANTALSNLGTTAINAHLIPDGNRTLGDQTNRWLRVDTQQVRSPEVYSQETPLSLSALGLTAPQPLFVSTQGPDDSGFIQIKTGPVDNPATNSGDTTIATGEAFDTTATSGDVILITGAADTPANRGNIVLNGRQIIASSRQIKDVADPTDLQDAATKAYVDSGMSTLGDLAALDQVDTAEIVNGAVINTKLANMNANTLKGRAAGNGTPQDLTASEVRTILAVETTTELNARDTANRDRANHTGTQLSSTISDFDEASQDAVAAAVAAGVQDGVVVAYDDVTNSFDFTNSDKGSVAVSTHESALDPHPQYLTEIEADLLYDVLGSASTVQTNLTNHINAVTDAHDASAISVVPTGNLTSTDVQNALEELQTDIDGLDFGVLPKVNVSLLESQVGTSVTGVTLSPSDINASLTASVAITADVNLFELFNIDAVYNGVGWFVSVEKVGDNTGVVFDVDNSGQLIYDSGAYAGFVSGSIYVRGVVH